KTGKLRAIVEGTVEPDFKRSFKPRFSPDGKLILARFENEGSFQLIDASTGKRRRTLGRERSGWGEKFSAEFHRDSKRLATSTDGRTVSLWNVDNGHLLAVF